MSRSLRVKEEYIETAKQSVKRNGYRSQQSLADDTNISLATISKFLNGKPVDFAIFSEICDCLSLDKDTIGNWDSKKGTAPPPPSTAQKNTAIDWGDAPDASQFYGRDALLSQLETWVGSDQCRLVALLGQGGIGKTTLAVRLLNQVQHQFDRILWRSLRNPISVDALLLDVASFLSNQQANQVPGTLDQSIQMLLETLKRNRCLIVLDNGESILQAGDRTGQYQPEYEGYGQLLRTIGETAHQSCLILTSREMPKGLATRQGQNLPIRSLKLEGLTSQSGRQLFFDKGTFQGDDSTWDHVIQHYGGNPLALKIVATMVEEGFDGDLFELVKLLEQGTLVFDDIADLLNQHLQRLTELERHILNWIAIHHSESSINVLRADLIDSVSVSDLLEVIKSLGRRSLIYKSSAGYTQQPAIMEYVLKSLGARMFAEITMPQADAGTFDVLNRYVLCKAHSDDYVREVQLQFIVKPLVERLIQHFGSEEALQARLVEILTILQTDQSLKPGYCAGNILTLLGQLSLPLAGLDVSGLPVWQADLRNVPLHQVNFAQADLKQSLFSETLGIMLSMAFSADGRFFATGGNGEIRLWNGVDMTLIATMRTTSSVDDLAFNPTGSLLACSEGHMNSVSIWRTEDGQLVQSLPYEGQPLTVAFSPDGHYLMASGNNGSIRLWEMASGEPVQHIGENLGVVWSMAVSADGTMIASGGDDARIRIWDRTTGDCLHQLDHGDCLRSVTFHPHAPLLASGGYDGKVKLWDIETSTLITELTGHAYPIRSVAFSPDGTVVASASQDRSIRLWQVNAQRCIKTLWGHDSSVWAIAFNPDGQTLASVGDDQTLRLWNPQTGQCLSKKQGHTYNVWHVAPSPNSNLLASAHSDRVVRLWDMETGQCLKHLYGHDSGVLSVAISPSDETIASGSQTIHLWHGQTYESWRTLEGHTSWVWSMAFSPDGQRLVSGSSDQTIRLWDVATGQCLNTLRGHSTIVWKVLFTADAQTIISASHNGRVKVWDVASGQCRETLNAHDGGVGAIALSPDGTILATGSYDTTIKLWDMATLKCIQTFSGHQYAVKSLTFNRDQTLLLSGSFDKTVKQWNLKDGQEVQSFEGHRNQVWSVGYSHDERFVVSGSHDETINVWEATTGQHLHSLEPMRLYEGAIMAGTKGLSQTQRMTLQAHGAVL